MNKYNSHYIIEGLEDFQPTKLSALLHLESGFFSLYKYLFRVGRKESEPLEKDITKSLVFCDTIIENTLKHNTSFYNDGFLMYKSVLTDEQLLQQYLCDWKDKIQQHNIFKENKAIQHFITTITAYYCIYTKKQEEMKILQEEDIELFISEATKGKEFLEIRIKSLKNILEKELESETKKANQGIAYQEYVDINNKLNKK